MYPNKIVFGLTLYDILISVGIIVCFLVFSYLADCARLKLRLQKFSLIVGVLAISLGFCSAILFQALYNMESVGGFQLTVSTGSTFYGGLIGGVTVFVVGYFGVGGLFFKNQLSGYHKEQFFAVARCAVPSIVVAHAFGRLGCLTAGCCHGAPTDAWYGILMHGDMGYVRYVPVQLFESLFLFALFGFLFLRARVGKSYNLSVYVIVYGIWRFFIEYARRDYRGSVPVEGLTPSQLIAILMVAAGIGVLFLERWIGKRAMTRNSAEEDGGSERENEQA